VTETAMTLDELADAIGQVIGNTARELEADFAARSAAVEARLARLEAMPRLKYMGVWRPGGDYQEGAMVSHSGSLWIAKSATGDERPGNGATSWQLAVKRGRA
jgi:hypothetical protein